MSFHEFLRIRFFALVAASGSVVREGNTLVKCAEHKDNGRENQNSDEDILHVVADSPRVS